MGKIYTALGLMSGTSMDGVDASIIKSDGLGQFHNFFDEYSKFDDDLHTRLISLRNKVLKKVDLEELSKELNVLERELTFFHNEIVNKISEKYKKSKLFFLKGLIVGFVSNFIAIFTSNHSSSAFVFKKRE